ncbi:MAG: PPOX class F420-dependent oxidoreductase [Actinomycetota bacterium]|nr:PPOX class F420-dependent oxidoreductase [Actinomycetota bacterium]
MLALTEPQLEFVRARHLATLTTLRADGSPHVVPVAFTWDAERGLARVTTRRGSVKARNLAAPGARAVLCQVDGFRWVTLEGTAQVSDDDDEIAGAVAAYADRYRMLEPNPERVVLLLTADRVMGSVR